MTAIDSMHERGNAGRVPAACEGWSVGKQFAHRFRISRLDRFDQFLRMRHRPLLPG